MSDREVSVNLINNTDVNLYRWSWSFDHGVWSENQSAPEAIGAGKTGTFKSEAQGFLTGVEGKVVYQIGEGTDNTDPNRKLVTIGWDCPQVGNNSYSRNLTDPATNQKYDIKNDNPQGTHVTVTFTLRHVADHVSPGDTTPNSSLVASVPPCTFAMAKLSADCVFVLLGAAGIHGKIPTGAIETVGKEIESSIPAIEQYCQILADAGTSVTDKASAIFKIGGVIFNAGKLTAVISGVLDNMSVADKAIYGTLATANLVAAFATDGVALIATIVAEIAQIGFVVDDAVQANNACK